MRIHGTLTTRAARAVLLACGLGCSEAPRSQWKVYLATNAPVPQLGDQLLVEVLAGTTTVDRRVLDASRAELWPVSFGVVPSGASTSVRIRFYRAAITGDDGLPATAALIDSLAELPPPGDGILSVGLVLDAACFGVPADLMNGRTCDPSTRALVATPTLPPTDPSQLPPPGSWSGAAMVDCAGPAPSGMICIPGGAFILGAPTFPHISSDIDPVPERLVVVGAYAIDADEMSVGTYRALIGRTGVSQPVLQNSSAEAEFCTFLGPGVSSADPMPVNCVPWLAASAACASLGKRLPTEAEWQFAAGNRTTQSTYPWGSDTNVCGHAVIARDDSSAGFPDCLFSGTITLPAGPAASGSSADVTNLGVLNMAGNMAEYVADWFAPYTSACWTSINPECNVGILHSVRGGSWATPPALADVALRAMPGDGGGSELGFRCALSM